jgi:hypothetical protein
MKCPGCASSYACAVDCWNAPWNWDKPKTNRFGFLKRLVKWLLGTASPPLSWRPLNLRWLY